MWAAQVAIEMERLGVPAVTVATDAFAEMGQDTARSLGLAGLPIVAAPSGLEDLDASEVGEQAERMCDEIVAAFTGDAPALESTYAGREWLSSEEAIAVTCAVTKQHALA